MIDTADIYKSIKTTISNNFDEIVLDKDIKTPTPPCFYVKYIDGINTQTATEYLEKKTNFDIIYFSSEESMVDLVEKEQLLTAIFSKPIKVDGLNKIYIEADSITTTFNESDYILNCRLEFIINQCIGTSETDIINRYDDEENEEYIEELEV